MNSPNPVNTTGDSHVTPDMSARTDGDAAPAVSASESGAVSGPDTSGPRERKSAAAVLVELAMDRYGFGCTTNGEPFAVPKTGGNIVRMLRGGRSSLRAELAQNYQHQTGLIAGQQALADALLVIEGNARQTEPVDVHLRVAEHAGATWIDLGDAAESVVRVDSRGWTMADDVPGPVPPYRSHRRVPRPGAGRHAGRPVGATQRHRVGPAARARLARGRSGLGEDPAPDARATGRAGHR
jgi:hypothetical protein